MKNDDYFDVVVIGGGPAGLSGALTLGRAVKRVLLCDAGPRRNAAAEHMHGFLTRDGISPAEFRRLAREQLRPYDVTFSDAAVETIERAGPDRLRVVLAGSPPVICARVLLATGMTDELPPLPGLRELWGRGVFACPYCHGWEVRGRRWGILARDAADVDLALLATGWTDDVVFLTGGAFTVDADAEARLEAANIAIERGELTRVIAGPDAGIEGLCNTRGHLLPLAALFTRPPQRQGALVRALGLTLDESGFVAIDRNHETTFPGVHAAGDLSSQRQNGVSAAAAGTSAAYAINAALSGAGATQRRR